MKKAIYIVATFIMMASQSAMATITKFTILTINGTAPSSSTVFTSTDWNKSSFSRKIPLSRTATTTYRIKFEGDFIDTHTRIEVTLPSGTGTVSGVTVSNISKATKAVTLDLRVSNSVTDGTAFRIRFRYFAEINCGEAGGCGDNVQFRAVNQGTISNISISPAPIRAGDTLILRNNTNYTLTYTLTGATGSETEINTQFNGSGDVSFSTPFLINKTASTFAMTIKANINSSTTNVLNRFTNEFFDSSIDTEFKQNTIVSRYIKYKISTSLSNIGANVNLKLVRGEKLPDLTPVALSPAINPFLRASSTNSFQGSGTNSYHPVDDSFCPNVATVQPFVDGPLSGTAITHNLTPITYGVKNIGLVSNTTSFVIKVIKFKAITDTSNAALGTVMNTTTIPIANAPAPGITRSATFNRPTVETFRIAGKTGCYIKRTNATTPNPTEEAAYKVIVDDTRTVTESNESNNFIYAR